MHSKAILISLLAAFAEARFGQEQIPIQAIQAVTSGGGPGVAATLAGSAISTLLGGANPCAKLQKADEIVAQLGTGADAIAAARGLVAAEQNFNPFAASIPSICSDPTLPTTLALRGVIPLVDPAVAGSDVENSNSATSLTAPFDATGLSVAEVMAAQGFSNFTTKGLNGAAGAAPVAVAPVVAAPVAAEPEAASSVAAPEAAVTSTAAAAPASAACPTTLVTVTVAPTAAPTAEAAAPAAPPAAPATGATPATTGGLDFGQCTPTIKFEAGLNGRKDTEFTFQAVDPLVNKGQQEALNPNIITNRICDQLINVCQASTAAHDACIAAKAQILALGTRDVTTADAWNTALGFAGADTNPDNAPQPGLIGHS